MSGLVPFNNNNKFGLRQNGFEGLYNMLDDFFSDTWPSRRSLLNDTFKLDVQENEKEYFIDAELPGINKDEVDIEFNDGRLLISVNREEKSDEKDKNYIHKERRYSSMQRSIYLADAESTGIKAKLDNGVLNITVPKQENSQDSFKINIE